MTTNISDFLLENVGSPIEKRKVHLKRFKSDFEIQCLTALVTDVLGKQASRRITNKRTHQIEQQTDQDKFNGLILTHSVVFPDLDNAELQTSYGCPGDPEKLLKKMLTIGEYNQLSQAVMDLSGLNDEDPDELVEEAKN